MSEPKTARAELGRLEATIYRTLRGTRESLAALVEIYDRELWRHAPAPKAKGKPKPYTSWHDYLGRRWPTLNLNAMHRRVKTESARARISLFGEAEGLSDRAVAVLADESPETQAAALELAAALAAGGTPTEADVRDAIEELAPEEEVAETKREEEEARAAAAREAHAKAADRSLRGLTKAREIFEKFLRRLGRGEEARAARATLARGIKLVDRLIEMVASAETSQRS